MNRFIISLIVVIVVTFSLNKPVKAQDDTLETSYGKILVVDFTPEKTQAFITFNGEKGDLVYVWAEAVDLQFGDKLEIDLRDKVGRSLGFKDEYLFTPFILAELTATNSHTLVVTYTSEKANKVKLIVEKTQYLSDPPASVTVTKDDFGAIFGFKIAKTGDYRVTFQKLEGDLSVNFSIVDFSDFLHYDAMSVDGTTVKYWVGDVTLSPTGKYVAFLKRSLLGKGSSAKVQLGMIPSPSK